MAEEWKGDENQNGATGPHYFVHYQGWKKTWDEWVPQTRLLKYNEENLARQKALVDAQKAEAAAAAAVAAAQAAEKEQASRAKADVRKAGTPTNGSPATSTSRGSKRSRESADADEQDKRPDLRLTIPEPLKAQLVDDWENVTRKEQLVPLPRQPNVKQILDDYAAYYQSKAKATTRARSPAVLTEVLAGLKLYFDKSLAQNLLYRFERPQYVEMRKRHGPKMGDGDVQTEIAAAKPGGGRRGRTKASAAKDEGTPSPAPAPPSTLTELEASALYGAEHLLRLFGTYLLYLCSQPAQHCLSYHDGCRLYCDSS